MTAQMDIVKNSPLAAIYRKSNASCVKVAGWNIAEHFGLLDAEKANLKTGSLLVDWSHIGKISIRGENAIHEACKIDPRANKVEPLHCCSSTGLAVLRCVKDEFLVLCQPGDEQGMLAQSDPSSAIVVNLTGAMGCFALAGQRRDEVWERSSTMNLRRDLVKPGGVIQTSIHFIPCTIYRTHSVDILVHNREFSESLYDALMDVGRGVGLLASGVASVPVSFEVGAP